MNARVHQPQRPAVHSDQHAASYYAATANRQLSYPTLAGEEPVSYTHLTLPTILLV